MSEPPRDSWRLYFVRGWADGKESNGRYPVEVRERAVRLVLEHRGEYASMWAAVKSIAAKFGCSPLTLQSWVRQAEVDGGVRSGTSTADVERIRELERENRELRRANEMA